MRRRAFLLATLAAWAGPRLGRATGPSLPERAAVYPPVVGGLDWSRDRGSHDAFRTEWWYLTGHLEAVEPGAAGRPAGESRRFGFQITFFRSRPPRQWQNSSRFNPEQLLFAHAALSEIGGAGRFLRDERAARAGFGLAGADTRDTDVWLDDWRLRATGEGYAACVTAADFGLDLAFARTQPALVHGERGVSRKGPAPTDASYYYSEPQLQVRGSLRLAGRESGVTGSAWLDHEWSSSYLPEGAAGWDWLAVNLDDGGALMLFRMRDRAGRALWAGGSHRDAAGRTRVFGPQEVVWRPERFWRSPATGARYPVAWTLRAGGLRLAIAPLADAQEMDTRASTGTVYWEGAVVARQPGRQAGRQVGAGYLELTGYWKPLERL